MTMMMMKKLPAPGLGALVCPAALLTLALGACTSIAPPTTPVSVKVLAINDFHGNLKPSPSGIRLKGEDPADPQKWVTLSAGGSEHLHTAVAELRRKNPNNIFVAAGDLIGGSPLLSALFHDEPTLQSLDLMGLDVAAVGNHEFDAGLAELLRRQYGGCHPKDGCRGPAPFKGSNFKYLAASTWDLKTGKTVLPPYYIKRFEGIDMAFIGLTLKGTPEIVTPAGVAGLRFDDEADTVNQLVPELKAKGVEAIVLLIHEGGVSSGGPSECPDISGPIVNIVKRLDQAVDLVVSGHTHRGYTCRIDGRLVTSAHQYGTLVTEIDVLLDRSSRDVISAQANNVVVRTERFAKAPEQTALIESYERLAAPLSGRLVGSISATISREMDASGAMPMGQLIADAQLAATRAADKGGARIALMNAGGVREALTHRPPDGRVSYGDLFTTQPFSNHLLTLSLSGEQIRRLLEEQFRAGPERPRLLQVSRGFAYSWDAQAPLGARVVPGSIKLDGRPLDMAASYRITVNSFIASGGDGFRVLSEGGQPLTGVMDVEALEAYLQAHPKLAPPALDRVQRVN